MTKNATAKVDNVKPAENAEPPKKKGIEPRHVQINSENFAWREVLVRLPEGVTADDLRDPKIWKNVQVSRQHALVKLDNLLILSFDESQAIRAVVTHATPTEAHLAIERVFTFREMGASFYTDGTLEVYWDGACFGVRRVEDKVRVVNEGFTTEPQAIAALRAWYPKVA